MGVFRHPTAFVLFSMLCFYTGYRFGSSSSAPALYQPTHKDSPSLTSSQNHPVGPSDALRHLDHTTAIDPQQSKETPLLKTIDSLEVSDSLSNEINALMTQAVDDDNIEQLVSKFSDRAIDLSLSRLLGKDALPLIDDKRAFSANIAKQIYSKDRTNPEIGSARFSLFIDSRQPGVTDFLFYPAQSARIYMHFQQIGFGIPEDAVIYWRHSDTGEMFHFSRHSFTAGQESSWVSYQPSDGWKEGTYLVSLHGLDNQASLLASARFTVFHLNQ